MWSISSASNVIGSMLFVPICHWLGVSNTLLLAAGCYLAAIAVAAWNGRTTRAAGRTGTVAPAGQST
jgi:hypothetical protein